MSKLNSEMRNLLNRIADKPVLHTHHSEPGNRNHLNSGKEKECSWAVVCLCLSVKWQKPDFLRMSWRVQCVWISWRIQWPSSVDTVTVRAVFQASGIRRIRESESLQLPSVQTDLQSKTWFRRPEEDQTTCWRLRWSWRCAVWRLYWKKIQSRQVLSGVSELLLSESPRTTWEFV